jgi:hypothetical protein
MFYRYALNIPAGTPEDDQVRVDFTLPQGVIAKVEVDNPDGCHRLAHTAIYHNEYKVWPTNPDEYFSADGYVISFGESYRLEDAWNAMSVRGWNEDTDNDHEIVVHLVLSQEAWGLEQLISVLTGKTTPVEV